ncbi:hypothetical protein Sste5346_007796 [Sporothrix stenoceras]|uniref:Uncharacterized protein n=1 Tax=Sporothrix stenoceras TaxID=5173 RepID=A0ABR3YT80_9PEZI
MVLAAIARNHGALGPEHIASLNGASRSIGILGGELSAAKPQPAHLYCTQYRQPSSSLDVYIKELSAPLYEFVAHLRITTRLQADFGVSELMKLALMPNLGILEIIEQPGSDEGRYGLNADGHLDSQQVSDRLVRGWSLTRPKPFPALRLLRLWGCNGNTLTPACLQYAADFPLLAHFDMSSASESATAAASTALDGDRSNKREPAQLSATAKRRKARKSIGSMLSDFAA